MSTELANAVMPPYVPYSTFSNFINGLAEHPHLPSHIDKSLMSKMSGSGQSALTAALKALQLIDDETQPAGHLADIVYSSPEERKQYFKAVVQSSYSFLFSEGFSIEKTTSKQVEAKFREHANASGSTLTKCISFFLSIAKDADISVSPHVKAPSSVRSTGSVKKKKAVATDVGNELDRDKEKEKKEISEILNNAKGMTKFDIPLKDTQNGIIYLPEGLTQAQAIKAIKMADFILRSYYEIDEE